MTSAPNSAIEITPDAATRPGVLRIFIARQILTMDESLPTATAVGVIDDRIVAVGDLASMAPWRAGREVVVDERLKDMVLMPGFIDNHVHPFLGGPCNFCAKTASRPMNPPGLSSAQVKLSPAWAGVSCMPMSCPQCR